MVDAIALLERYEAYVDSYLQTFREDLSVRSLRVGAVQDR